MFPFVFVADGDRSLERRGHDVHVECVLVVKGVVDFRVGIVVVEIQFSMNRLLNAQTIHWSRTRSWRRGASLSYGRSISWELNAMHSSFNDAYGGRGRRSLSWALGRNVSACWA